MTDVYSMIPVEQHQTMTLIDYRTWACQRDEHDGCYATENPRMLPWWLCACPCHRKERKAS